MLSPAITAALWKRDLIPSDTPTPHSADWVTVLIFLGNVVVFLPALIFLTYTLDKVFPIFASIEDEAPPLAYDRVPNEPLAADEKTDLDCPAQNDEPPITSSVPNMVRTLRSHGGFRAMFRGLVCHSAQATVSHSFVLLFALAHVQITPYLFPLCELLGSLLAVQLSTTWVHVVITPESAKPFWYRLPPFQSTLKATWKPTVIFWLARQLVNWVVLPIAQSFKQHGFSELPDSGHLWRSAALLLVVVALQILLIIPASIVLIRIQASLLPEHLETIIPFDRTFQGKVQPTFEGGLGYATLSDAWCSFTNATWRRLVILHVKIFFLSSAAVFTAGIFISAQMMLISVFSGN